MIKIDKDIIRAIRHCKNTDFKNETKLAQAVGVRQATINDWANGVTKSIQAEKWERLLPIIGKYLPASYSVSVGDTSNSPGAMVGNIFLPKKRSFMLSKEDKMILDWFNQPENETSKYKLLAEIAVKKQQKDASK